MRSNSKHTTEEIERYILMYLNEGFSFKELKEAYGLLINWTSFWDKVLRYQEHGISGIQVKSKYNKYSKEFKDLVVKEYLEDRLPIGQLAVKYNIPKVNTIRSWINKYTKGEEIMSYSPKSEVYTMTDKKSTQEEKIKIVQDCLANSFSYKETAEKYQVSYNNVYSWVKKYKKHGPDGLVDGRGRGKPNSVQTEEDRIRAENAALRARNEYLETENTALKKLEEVERELMLRKHGMKRSTKQSRSSKKKGSK